MNDYFLGVLLEKVQVDDYSWGDSIENIAFVLIVRFRRCRKISRIAEDIARILCNERIFSMAFGNRSSEAMIE